MFGVANEWEKHVVFVLGRKWKIAGPGLYFYPPAMGRVVQKIDTRIITFTAPAQ